ncbi:acetolactate synthase large subunit [Brevundimonas sp.]|uniref:acetolactate synthase large subunit n=1 Tax=Brevundimonas sp. TaxID=1871086 RepID=UPI002B5FDDA9|nr:acetolactate synthase large subunit [Brevundimonas sp.]HWQ87310.1 acetolactate synthase large subunit [Brevundimonas sp.]
METAVRMLETFADGGVEVCFANPGTSEMHLVAALDRVPRIRPVPGLFEGVVTGAADGYGRMRGAPALTLLHLGPGLSNGSANLHNAFRARTPIINLVGDHAVAHRANDAPLQSDIESLARPVSRWFAAAQTPQQALELASWSLDAAAREGPGTLVLPADVAWSDADTKRPTPGRTASSGTPTWDRDIDRFADRLRTGGCALVLGGRRLGAEACAAAARIGAATGAMVLTDTFPARVERGRGRVALPRIPYLIEMSAGLLAGARTVILAGAPAPVAFFALPGRPMRPTAGDAEILTLCDAGEDPTEALVALAEAVSGAASDLTAPPAIAPGLALSEHDRGLDPDLLARVVAATLPANAIVCDESISLGLYAYDQAAGAAPHDWLSLTGGAIGQGLPLATGAAIACPDRRVVALQADGSALYTVQALWTQARESLDVTNVILNNGAYAILNMELARAGASPGGRAAQALFDLTRPAIDFCALAAGFGVPATRVRTAGELAAALARAQATPGPSLIEAMFP